MPRSRAFEPIVYGGLTAAALDILNASTFWFLTRGVKPVVILHGIAAGLIGGKAAAAGGLPTAVLGAFLHVFIACVMAAVYWYASLRLPALLRSPVVYGMCYGVVCYLVMENIVLPLSATHAAPFQPAWFLDDVIGHALLVGLPIALIARWSAAKIRP
jgi:hypothetical protein